MRNKKYYLCLTNAEHRLIIQCLLNFQNKLLSQGQYTDGVDEVIIKFSKQQQAREVDSRTCCFIYQLIE